MKKTILVVVICLIFSSIHAQPIFVPDNPKEMEETFLQGKFINFINKDFPGTMKDADDLGITVKNISSPLQLYVKVNDILILFNESDVSSPKIIQLNVYYPNGGEMILLICRSEFKCFYQDSRLIMSYKELTTFGKLKKIPGRMTFEEKEQQSRVLGGVVIIVLGFVFIIGLFLFVISRS